MEDKLHSCCFIGHRETKETEELKERLYKVTEELIVEKGVYIFYFGSMSRFNSLCVDIAIKLKEKYSHIKLIYVRSAFPYITDHYKNYLLDCYDDTYCPKRVINAGRAAYVERNREMIDNSSFCVVYYKEGYDPRGRKSGTEIAYNYAVKKNLKILNVYNNEEIKRQGWGINIFSE